MIRTHTIIAYACEDTGSEPGVGYHWTKTIAKIDQTKNIIIITRKNNDVSYLTENYNIHKVEIDLPKKLLFIKKIIGIRLYYFIWIFMVFWHLLLNFSKYNNGFVHHITFTPIYYPPLYFCLPFKFYWGPVGGGENYPVSYYKSMYLKDIISEFFRSVIKYTIYFNPLFYFGCFRAKVIICSTDETARLIPKFFKNKIFVELMVMDSNKNDLSPLGNDTIVIANRLINWKMTHLFVDAFNTYANESKTLFKLIIIGNGPYLNKIKPHIDNVRIFHQMRFEKRIEMLSTLKNSSLFVSMSLRDSGAASLLEAVNFGVPYLITDSGAHQLFLKNGVGYSFKLSNYEEDKLKIVNLLYKVLSDKDGLQLERENVKNLYNNVFSETVKIKRISKIF
jgi:hypothetical protein